VRYGFVVDNRKCIGCHACSVACKAENPVPLGVFRTWVKSVEKGRFPDTRRHFQVTRCNHCDKPPCVAVCPVAAMFRRGDGIVDFDPSRCIGCKACEQACPYDSIYIDPGRGTAAKCHFCAHRVEVGMEPACVVACPEHAIIAGDIDDPASEISGVLAGVAAGLPVSVRRPECGTEPKLWYVAAEQAVIVPGEARNVGAYLFATVNASMPGLPPDARAAPVAEAGPTTAVPAVVSYDVEHERPWGWEVPAYFWTKSVATGALLVPAAARLTGGAALSGHLQSVLCLVALVFMAVTTALLVGDLERPERFLRVLTSPQKGSWVARGAYCLVGYGICCAALLLSSLVGAGGLSSVLLWPVVIAALPASVYTAFLFGQCRGRDLWQTRLLPWHLLAQCVTSSGAVLALVPGGLGLTAALRHAAVVGLVAGLGAHALVVLRELALPHAAAGARQAAHLITRGPFRRTFWTSSVAVGLALPAALFAVSTTSATVVGLAGAAALVGLGSWEWCFVMAGQGVANS
jgi:Fe-S-cluster-containing dehydrogenase component/formate-dependent nitrite reductase membrane component NrfD